MHFNWTRYWIPFELSTQDYDFLPDPETFFGNPQLVHFEDIRNIRCLVLLGSPGVGKSTTIQDIVSGLKAAGASCILKDLRDYENFASLRDDLMLSDEFSNWRDGSGPLELFLDSLDEGLLVIKHLEHAIKRFLENLPLDRLYLRITCRAAELPRDFASMLDDLWPSDSQQSKNVRMYQLTQLRKIDVERAARQRRFDGRTFIDAVEERGVASFAAYPVTLNMLFNIYSDHGALPERRTDIYFEGCRYLAQETSESRIDDGFSGQFDVPDRLEAARHLAAISILGNRPRIYSGTSSADGQGISRLCDCYANGDLGKRPEALLKEVLQSGLFTTRGKNYHIWAHLSYGEYLAASFIALAEMSLEAVQGLFINHDDPDLKIAPRLYETAAWLASMRNDVFTWILNTEPLLLVRSRSISLSEEQKASLVDRFMVDYAENKIIDHRIGWDDYERLNYAGLGTQLSSYLLDKQRPLAARELAIELIYHSKIATIDEALVTLALDPHESVALRRAALATLTSLRHDNEICRDLRPILLDSETYQADSEMVAHVIDILWPIYLTAEELFGYLYLPTLDEEIIGSTYDHLLRDKLLNSFSKDQLPIALRWVAQQDLRHNQISPSGEYLVTGIMRQAFACLDDQELRLSFARAAWSLLTQYTGVLTSRAFAVFQTNVPQDDPIQKLHQDEILRHELLQTMLAVLTPDGLKNEHLLFSLIFPYSQDFPLVLKEDTYWLLEQALQSTSDYCWAYCFLISRVVTADDSDLLSLIYKNYELGQNSILVERFQGWFEAIRLDSSQAEEGRKYLAQRREYEAQQAEQTEQFKINDALHEWLDKCDEDSANWWIFTRILLAENNGFIYRQHWDLRQANGWQYVSDDEQTLAKVLLAAWRYINDQNPYIGNVKPEVPLLQRHPALAGCHALILLGLFDLLGTVSCEAWQRWATTVVFNTHLNYFDDQSLQVLNKELLTLCFANSADSILQGFRLMLDQLDEEYEFEAIFKRFEYGPAESIDPLLLGHLQDTSAEASKYCSILAFLLRRNSEVSYTAQRVAESTLKRHILEMSFGPCKGIIKTLANNAKNNQWWSIAWDIFTSDHAIVEDALAVLADRSTGQFLRYLTENQLRDLYIVATEIYAFEDDIVFHGGAVPPRHTQQQWRDSILLELAGRGTVLSVTLLTELYYTMHQRSDIGRLLENARARFRLESWRPPTPMTILTLAKDSKTRHIRNPGELLELIVKTLNSIELSLHGTASMQRAIWDKQANGFFRPVEEEAFSDAIAVWLRDRLIKIVVNREVEVRQHTETPRGDRTDITVEMVSDIGEPLIVIIEVKGCWHSDVYGCMQTQLVDQYLANHDRCSYGLYLVGYFSSAQWDPDDKRSGTCESRGIEILSGKLNEEVHTLKTLRPVGVKPHIFDASM